MTELAREYGEGLYELAVEEGKAEEILRQLRQLDGIFAEQPDFFRLLSNRALSVQERLGILDNVLRGRAEPYVLNFLKMLCQRDAIKEFHGCAAVFAEHYHLDNHIAVAHVTTPTALSDAQRERLVARLKGMTGREIELNERVDPAVLGGVMLEMDGKRWDNTVKSRLNALRRILTED